MIRTVFVNNQYLPEDRAQISIFDRGFLMADAVYEVTAVARGRLLDFDAHLRRLDRSLGELQMAAPYSYQQWLEIHRRLIELNQLTLGIVYLQVSRGNPGDRDFRYPAAEVPSTVIAFTQAKPDLLSGGSIAAGLRVVSVPDWRWARRDIKTTQLLYPSMAKMAAVKAGVDDAWFVKEGYVTEGSSNNCYIVVGRRLITRPLNEDILHGITRSRIVRLAEQMGLEVDQRPFSLEQAFDADEAFITSASAFVTAVVEVDGRTIGSGLPGPWTQQLRAAYIDCLMHEAI